MQRSSYYYPSSNNTYNYNNAYYPRSYFPVSSYQPTYYLPISQQPPPTKTTTNTTTTNATNATNAKSILVTGGTGYIGSHTVVELLTSHYKDYNIVVVDNLINSSAESMNRVQKITGKKPIFIQCDIQDEKSMEEKVFKIYSSSFVAAIHFAGLKAVGESVTKPLEYFINNVNGTYVLLKLMKKYNVKNIVFSSSATVYGVPNRLPIDEEHSLGPTNPYGHTKLHVEDVLKDIVASDKSWKVVILRYFNPVGAHESGLIGEDPSGIPNNLMPFVAQTAVGRREKVTIFGKDYKTPDGTGVRDYVHVVDLAKAHLCGLDKILNNNNNNNNNNDKEEKEKTSGCFIYNIGTGRGYSVLEMINAFEKACGHSIPYVFGERRAGDVDSMYSSCDKAKKELNWEAKFDLEAMCRDQWKWQSNNPKGFNK